MEYRFTEKALEALDEIAHYIALDNENAAYRVTDNILETCEMLTEMPAIGRYPSFAVDTKLRYCPTKKYNHYLIFYRVEESYIAIVDIIHASRDLPDLFGE